MKTLSSYQDFIQNPQAVEIFYRDQKIFCRDVTAANDFAQLCGSGVKYVYRCQSCEHWQKDDFLIIVTEKNNVIYMSKNNGRVL